jgi:hypothetical protein
MTERKAPGATRRPPDGDQRDQDLLSASQEQGSGPGMLLQTLVGGGSGLRPLRVAVAITAWVIVATVLTYVAWVIVT